MLMTPTADSRWSVVYGINSYEAYFTNVAERIYLKPCVHEDIHSMFKVVQKLIDLAYYEYEFIDVACMKALLALELAFKKRYEEVTSDSLRKNRSLQWYINWFSAEGYFETDVVAAIHQLREIRNYLAHPERHGFGGPMTSWPIQAATQLINDLYEDRALRQSRKTEKATLNSRLDLLLNGGALLEVTGAEVIYVYRFTTTFINNKDIVPSYHFAYKSLFEIDTCYEKGDPMRLYPSCELQCSAIITTDDSLIGVDENRNLLFKLYKATGKHKQALEAWYADYRAYVEKAIVFEGVDGRSIADSSTRRLMEFHQLQTLSQFKYY